MLALWLIVGLGFATVRMAKTESNGNVEIFYKVQRSEWSQNMPVVVFVEAVYFGI